MQQVLSKLGKLIYKQNTHYGYQISWADIKPLIKCWNKNRPPDMTRVNEMINHHKNDGFLPPYLCLAECNGYLVCYDGNHRRECFSQLDEDLTVIIDVIFDTTDADIFTAFNDVNKSVQLPLIYTEDKDNMVIKEEIMNLVKTYEK
jgi:hypothetical protein